MANLRRVQCVPDSGGIHVFEDTDGEWEHLFVVDEVCDDLQCLNRVDLHDRGPIEVSVEDLEIERKDKVRVYLVGIATEELFA